jgi:hypothetical protein
VQSEQSARPAEPLLLDELLVLEVDDVDVEVDVELVDEAEVELVPVEPLVVLVLAEAVELDVPEVLTRVVPLLEAAVELPWVVPLLPVAVPVLVAGEPVLPVTVDELVPLDAVAVCVLLLVTVPEVPDSKPQAPATQLCSAVQATQALPPWPQKLAEGASQTPDGLQHPPQLVGPHFVPHPAAATATNEINAIRPTREEFMGAPAPARPAVAGR